MEKECRKKMRDQGKPVQQVSAEKPQPEVSIEAVEVEPCSRVGAGLAESHEADQPRARPRVVERPGAPEPDLQGHAAGEPSSEAREELTEEQRQEIKKASDLLDVETGESNRQVKTDYERM